MSVLFDVADHVARVTIDRPDRMNAVDQATEAELERVWSEIEARDDIRCVVLTGAGEKAFSAGADLKSNTGLTGLEYWAQANPNGFGGIALRQSLTVPVIARVNGLALGGGLEMVLGADIVIASETAKFGLPEAKVGRLPLDGGMVALQRLIPRNIADRADDDGTDAFGRRGRAFRSGQRGRVARCARRRGRCLGRGRPVLRSAFGRGDQGDGARRPPTSRRRKPAITSSEALVCRARLGGFRGGRARLP